MSLFEEGQEIARKLGGEVIYKGPWLPNGEKGEFYGHWFTDVLTGSSFAAKTLEEAKATLIQSRKDWGAKPPVFANNPAGEEGKMPEERRISPAMAIIPVGLGLGLLGILAAVAWAALPEEEVPPEEEPEEPPPLAVPWAFSNVSCFTEPSGVGMWYQVNYSATITNIGDREVTKTVTLWRKYDVPILEMVGDWYIVNKAEVTLAPGESYLYNSKDLIQYDVAAESYLVDSDGYESTVCYTPMVPSGTI